MTTLERRHSERARIPCNIPVELTDTTRSAQFDADAVDLSVGGLSLRAAEVPDVGSQLFCSFEAMPGGAQVLGRGEVVWRQPAADQGDEFGLRFVEVDPRNQALIDEMVAERIARIESPFTQREPVLASLEIENVATPVSARLLHAGETEALFEQTLDQFALGKSVTAHAGVSLVRGHISSVTLRMEGSTPRLVLTLQMPRDSARFGEFEWGEPGSDTDPDIFGNADDRRQRGAAEAEPVAPVAPPSAAAGDDEHREVQDDAVQLTDEEPAEDGLPDFRRERSRTLSGLGQAASVATVVVDTRATDAREPQPTTRQLPLFTREGAAGAATLLEPGGLHLSLDGYAPEPERDYPDEEAIMELLTSDPASPGAAGGHHHHAHGGRDARDAHDLDGLPTYEEPSHSPVIRFLRVLARVVETFRSSSERLRELVAQVRGASSERVGRGLFSARPRVVTATTTSTPRTPKNRNLLTLVAVGSFGILALVLIAYAVLPAGPAPYSPQHSVGPEPGQADRAGGDNSETTTAAASDVEDEPRDRRSGDIPNTHVATSADAVETRSSKSGVRVPTTQFGQRQIRNPRRVLLRMSDPVKYLRGTSDPGGFSVVIENNHALEKAAPIKSAHPAIARAIILNRKDHTAELIVRFVPGQSPAFRVTGHGSAVEVLLEQ